ncbi:hypothetical protein BDV95DRAFT_375901 [Massariosphaeria phaeospora]|uniref:Uncharacterized protein n=1 Tax=Massariosphaeria phaeospora TaxID=100035 RepID=A0A7C8I8A5_9PLEO|nr:hypothetical protein BDV95DRAFT_375901 [Massariosphaeria phaeospora]
MLSDPVFLLDCHDGPYPLGTQDLTLYCPRMGGDAVSYRSSTSLQPSWPETPMYSLPLEEMSWSIPHRGDSILCSNSGLSSPASSIVRAGVPIPLSSGELYDKSIVQLDCTTGLITFTVHVRAPSSCFFLLFMQVDCANLSRSTALEQLGQKTDGVSSPANKTRWPHSTSREVELSPRTSFREEIFSFGRRRLLS